METLFCKHCNKEAEFSVVVKSNNHVAHCLECGSYIKNVPHSSAKSVFYFGKYKGTEVDSCTDIQYLRWVLDNVKLTEKMRLDMSTRLQILEYNYK